MNRAIFFFLAIGLGVLAIVAAAQATPSARDFVSKAQDANQFEISLGRLALQNSHDSDVKHFAQQMVDDHTTVASKLKTTLSSSQSDIASPDNPLTKSERATLDKLNKLSGPDFDKKYVDLQVKAHDDAVSLFGDYARHGDDNALKSFAADTLPTLKEHQKHARKLQASM